MRFLALAAAALLAAGCLGTDRTFPDESIAVRAIHVNAYADPNSPPPRDAVIEVRGLADDGQPRAFRGTIHIALERQHAGEPVTYSPVKAWDVGVAAPEFASQTEPLYRLVVPARDFPEESTYRASAVARIAGHEAMDASALFAYTRS